MIIVIRYIVGQFQLDHNFDKTSDDPQCKYSFESVKYASYYLRWDNDTKVYLQVYLKQL